MDIEQFRKAGYQAIDRICDYYYDLQNRSVTSKVEPGYLKSLIPSKAPERGEDFQVIVDDYQKFIVPGFTHWQHPSFFAYFPTSCTFEGILGDLYASSTCNPGFNWSSSPACTELESIVMDWAAHLLGLSSIFTNSMGVGGGCIQTTASDSSLVAVVAARSLYQRKYPSTKLEDLVIYTTSQTHSLGAKAGLVLGLHVRPINVHLEDQFALRGEALRSALEEDAKVGRKPFILSKYSAPLVDRIVHADQRWTVATLGSTSSGAVDNIAEIREIVKDYPDLWVHIDAAWAGVALSCPEYRSALYLEEINSFANSFCTNFHKWGLVNFDCSAFWVRDRSHLTEALDITPTFLRTKYGDSGKVIDYRNWHLGLGRRFRSLKLWFVLRGFGVEGLRNHIRRCIELNQIFSGLIDESDILRIVAKPSLALSTFRLVESSAENDNGLLDESLNQLNSLFYGRLATRDDIMLTQTTLNGVFCIRFSVGAARTTKDHIHNAFNIINEEARSTLANWKISARLDE